MLFTTQVVRKTKQLATRAELVLELAEGNNPEGIAAILALSKEVGDTLALLSVVDDAHCILIEVLNLLWQRAKGIEQASNIDAEAMQAAFSWPLAARDLWLDCPLTTLLTYEQESAGGQ